MEYTSAIKNAILNFIVDYHQNNYDDSNQDKNIDHIFLPTSDTGGNVKCLDFDLDAANFNSFPSLYSLFTDSSLERKETRSYIIMPAPPSSDKNLNKNNKEITIDIDNFKEKLHLPHSDSMSECDEEDEIVSYPICDIV